MAKSDKLYKSSPSIKRGEDGKVGVSKPTKADSEDMGLSDGAGVDGDPSAMPIHVSQSIDEIHERHQAELKDMHKRHLTEYENFKTKLAGTPAEEVEDKED